MSSKLGRALSWLLKMQGECCERMRLCVPSNERLLSPLVASVRTDASRGSGVDVTEVRWPWRQRSARQKMRRPDKTSVELAQKLYMSGGEGIIEACSSKRGEWS